MSDIRAKAAIAVGGLAVVAFAEYDSNNNPIRICFAVFCNGAFLASYPTLGEALAHLQRELESIDQKFVVIDESGNKNPCTGLELAQEAVEFILKVLLDLVLSMCNAPGDKLEQIYRDSNCYSLGAPDEGIRPVVHRPQQSGPKMEPN